MSTADDRMGAGAHSPGAPTYSPGEVETLLDIPGSSLRRYVSTFAEHFSADAKRIRGRRFSEQDLAIVARIRELAAQGVRLDAIAEKLGSVEKITVETALDFPGIQKRLEEIRSLFTEQQAELNTIKQRLQELETLQHQEPWYRRLFRR